VEAGAAPIAHVFFVASCEEGSSICLESGSPTFAKATVDMQAALVKNQKNDM
jgi:hypothetical protein